MHTTAAVDTYLKLLCCGLRCMPWLPPHLQAVADSTHFSSATQLLHTSQTCHQERPHLEELGTGLANGISRMQASLSKWSSGD